MHSEAPSGNDEDHLERRRIIARYLRPDFSNVNADENLQMVDETEDIFGFCHPDKLAQSVVNEHDSIRSKNVKYQRRLEDMLNKIRDMKPHDDKYRINDKEAVWHLVEAKRNKRRATNVSKKSHLAAEHYGESFAKIIYKGVPLAMRESVWFGLLNGSDTVKQAELFPTKNDYGRRPYKDLLLDGLLCSESIVQIDKDVRRTMRNHKEFRKRYGSSQVKLFRVLVAYSVHNPAVSYCQGMSSVAAILSLYITDEVEVFWCMDNLFRNKPFEMEYMFAENFPKFHKFSAEFIALVKHKLPKLYKRIDQQQISCTSIYAMRWFFNCFFDCVPFHIAVKVWDVYLYEGDIVLIAMSFTIFKMHERRIMHSPWEDTLEFLQDHLKSDFGFPAEQVTTELASSIRISRDHREQYRKKLHKQHTKEAATLSKDGGRNASPPATNTPLESTLPTGNVNNNNRSTHSARWLDFETKHRLGQIDCCTDGLPISLADMEAIVLGNSATSSSEVPNDRSVHANATAERSDCSPKGLHTNMGPAVSEIDATQSVTLAVRKPREPLVSYDQHFSQVNPTRRPGQQLSSLQSGSDVSRAGIAVNKYSFADNRSRLHNLQHRPNLPSGNSIVQSANGHFIEHRETHL